MFLSPYDRSGRGRTPDSCAWQLVSRTWSNGSPTRADLRAHLLQIRTLSRDNAIVLNSERRGNGRPIFSCFGDRLLTLGLVDRVARTLATSRLRTRSAGTREDFVVVRDLRTRHTFHGRRSGMKFRHVDPDTASGAAPAAPSANAFRSQKLDPQAIVPPTSEGLPFSSSRPPPASLRALRRRRHAVAGQAREAALRAATRRAVFT
jgi:hypothetical protein